MGIPRSNRSRPLLGTLAVISLLVLGVLSLGCFAKFGVGCFHNVVAGPHPHVLTIVIGLDCGRVTVYWEHWNSPTGKMPSGTHISWLPLRFRTPDLRRMLWEFDAHSMSLVQAKNLWVFLLAFPIWCVAIPCLIAPLWWLCKHRNPQPAGFQIVPTKDAKPD
jgi:hypothetical protein